MTDYTTHPSDKQVVLAKHTIIIAFCFRHKISERKVYEGLVIQVKNFPTQLDIEKENYG